MDHTIMALLSESARNLLSTSSIFEPFVPYSQQNTHYALNLLGVLAETTRNSLKFVAETPPQVQIQASKSKPPLAPRDQSVLEALMELRNSGRNFRRTPGIYSPILRSQPS